LNSKSKKKQLKAQKQAAEAREKDVSKAKRKDDTRIKILIGSYLKKKMDNNEEEEKILAELNEYLTEDRDRSCLVCRVGNAKKRISKTVF
jgi:hypothetical protein